MANMRAVCCKQKFLIQLLLHKTFKNKNSSLLPDQTFRPKCAIQKNTLYNNPDPTTLGH